MCEDLDYKLGVFIELKRLRDGQEIPDFFLIAGETKTQFRLKRVNSEEDKNVKRKTDNITTWEEYDLLIDVVPMLDCEIQMIIKDKYYHRKHPELENVSKKQIFSMKPRVIDVYEKQVIKGLRKHETDIYSYLACFMDP